MPNGTMPDFLKIFNPYKINDLKRLGNKYDGGYVLHAPSLKDVDLLITYGVGYNVEFEKDFNKFTGAPVIAFDPTMKELRVFAEKIKNGQVIKALKQFRWLLKWLAAESDLKKYKITFVEEGISVADSEKYKSFSTHIKRYQLSNKNILLKIDIDGGEYEIFNDPDFCKNLNLASQILLEFHDLDKNLVKVHDILQKLAATHSLIHIHGNNYGEPFVYAGKEIPKVIEVSLIKNDLLPEKIINTQSYPVDGLDNPCDKTKEDVKLDFFK